MSRASLFTASVVVAALSGCGILDAPPGPEVPPGCGPCTSEIADLTAELENSPDVVDVRSASLSRNTSDRGWLRLTVDLDAEDVVSSDVGALVDAVAKAAWRSAVDPLDALSLDVRLRNGYSETTTFFFGEDRDSYEEQWGARPAGSEWTPVEGDSDDSDGAEGCERDRCHELMRAIAVEVSDLPRVEAVLGADYVPSSPTNSTSADIAVVTDGTDVSEQVAEVVWRSRVAPIKLISVTAVEPGGGFPETTTFQVDPDVGEDHDRLQQQWGPRPVDE